MTLDKRDKIYETADAACRSAASAWSAVYEFAVQANDKNLWVIEEAVWTAYVQACAVRNAAIEQQQDAMVGYRQRGRDAALSRMLAGPTPAPAPAPVAPAPPAAPPAPAAAGVGETQLTAPVAPAAVEATVQTPPAPAPLSNAQSAWERAEAAALAADQGLNGVDA